MNERPETPSIADMIAQSQREEAVERWAQMSRVGSPNYTGEPCVNCGRVRAFECNDGRIRCEKCSFVGEALLPNIPPPADYP